MVKRNYFHLLKKIINKLNIIINFLNSCDLVNMVLNLVAYKARGLFELPYSNLSTDIITYETIWENLSNSL